MEVTESDGPRGGEYFNVRLADGRVMSVSRKAGDQRYWLGRPGDSYAGQRGGTGTIEKGLAEYHELYSALRALKDHKAAH